MASAIHLLVGIALDQLGGRRERLGLLSQLVERVRPPVQRGVGPRALGLRQLGEALDRALPAAFLERLLAFFVQPVLAIAPRRVACSAPPASRSSGGSRGQPRSRATSRSLRHWAGSDRPVPISAVPR